MPTKKFGEVYKRKDSPYLWIWYYNSTGRRCHESAQTTDKKVARQILQSRIAEYEGLRHGIKTISDMPYDSFGELLLKYYRARYGYETVKSHTSAVNEFQKFLNIEGLSRLSDIDKAVIDRFITYKRTTQHNRANTCNNYLKNLHRQFEFAIENKLMIENPLPPKYEKVPVTDAKEKKALSKEEYQQVMGAIKARYPFYYPVFYIYFHTGLRFSELINQRWKDILWEHSVLRVTKPKGKKSAENDIVSLHPGVIKALKSLPQAGDYVFTDEDGTPFTSRTRKFIRRLQNVANKLGIKGCVLHTTRHTFCSQLFDIGLTLPEVQAQMRHRELRTTQTYAHMFRPQLNKKMNRLQRLDRKTKRPRRKPKRKE